MMRNLAKAFTVNPLCIDYRKTRGGVAERRTIYEVSRRLVL